MYNQFKIKSIVPSFMMVAVAALFMGSCTVYKYVDAPSEDGIYSSTREYRGQADNYSESNNYYRQYFQSKQGSYSEILGDQEESAIFTDIEAYNTRDYVGEDGYVYTERVPAQEEQYGGWGNNATTVSINLYGGGHGGYYDPFYYNSFYGNWGYPYYGYGHYPRWRSGFSWWSGWNGFYSPFYSTPYYYNNYRPYRPYYDNVAHNRGRRNSNYSSRSATSGRSNNSMTRGRNANQSEGRRSNNSTISRREGSTTNNSVRRNPTINSDTRRSGNEVRRNDNQSIQRNATSPTSRRVTFPEQSINNRKIAPQPTRRPAPTNTRRMQQQQPTRRPAPANTRRTPQPTRSQTPAKTRRSQQPRQQQPAVRPSTPSRSSSPSMRSAPTRSSAPASRGSSGRSSGGRR